MNKKLVYVQKGSANPPNPWCCERLRIQASDDAEKFGKIFTFSDPWKEKRHFSGREVPLFASKSTASLIEKCRFLFGKWLND